MRVLASVLGRTWRVGGLWAPPGASIGGGRILLPLLLALLALATPVSGQDVESGKAVYRKWCVECHGDEGEGDGPAAEYMLPRPRDFAQARYQIRTTANGELPTDGDIRRVLDKGMPGTAMPAWSNLSDDEKTNLITYLKSLSFFFEDAEPILAELGSDPGGGAEAIEIGREVFDRLECWKCHGRSGRGNGPSSPTLEDWRELPIRAADLTEPWMFNGGGGAEAIHTRMLTGLDGTPMPAYSDALEAGVVTSDEMWQLGHYVADLAPTGQPQTADLVKASRVEGSLPEAPDDPAWDAAESFFIPLVGQIIRPPRNFSPTVDGVWMQALHNGSELAVRLTWGDPSASPDTMWVEWEEKMMASLFADGADLSGAALLPDGLALQLPSTIPDGMERPYFLMGDSGDPVVLWTWDSQQGVREANGRGLGRIEQLAGSGLTGRAAYDDGRWRLVFKRPLTAEGDGSISLAEGVAIPLAVFAWDGSSAETSARGSVSSWLYVYLEEPVSSAVWIVPLVAALLTAAVLMLLVSNARRRATVAATPAQAV